MKNASLRTLDRYLIENPEAGEYKLDRRVFTDSAIFEMEQKYIFQKIWVYLAHESQIAKPKQFITGWIGRQPIILNRNKKGEIQAFINACRHRGATLCRQAKGRTGLFVCPFHGWTYNENGELIAAKDEQTGGYPASFDKSELGLTRVPRVESYRGFIFASLNESAKPLKQWLGEASKLIDMMVDQYPEGLEVLKGTSTYTFDGNWKMQAENGVDGYHVTTVHWNYVSTVKHRAEIQLKGEKVKVMAAGDLDKTEGGYFDFGHGHTLLWGDWNNPEIRPIYSQRERLISEFGDVKANWMIGRLRNLLIYPNVFLMDQMSSQIRMFRPIDVDKTEVTIYCIAPIGEPAEDRRKRIRQFEDFFNASGMATPDDLSEFNACQIGAQGEASRWSDMSRGAVHQVQGPNDFAREIDINPLSSGAKIEDEGIFVAQHRAWLELMREGAQDGA